MKVLKKIQALILVAIIAIMSFGTTAFAAEVSPKNSVTERFSCTEEIPDDVNSIQPRILTTIVDQSFTMSSVHTGSTRTYNYNNLGAICTFTDMNGNIPADGTILAIRLYDSNNNLVKEWQGNGGNVICNTVGINYGGRYYFKYLVAYGTQNLKLHMLIVSAP